MKTLFEIKIHFHKKINKTLVKIMNQRLKLGWVVGTCKKLFKIKFLEKGNIVINKQSFLLWFFEKNIIFLFST